MTVAFKKFDLTGRSAFVTGGSAGLGYYLARGLARSGAKVMIAARREGVLREAAEKLTAESAGNPVLYHAMDLADRASVDASARHAIATLGGVDVFVGNAALEIGSMVDGITNEMMDAMCQVNLTANFVLTRSFLPHMRQQKWGRVIFSSSITSIRAAAEEGMAMYSAMKGALNSYTQVAASELGHDGITVNSLNLGVYYTEMWQHNILDMVEQMHGPGSGAALNRLVSSTTALGRLGNADEVEGLAQLLASDAGSYFTGAPIVIDGGMSIMLKPKAVPADT